MLFTKKKRKKKYRYLQLVGNLPYLYRDQIGTNFLFYLKKKNTYRYLPIDGCCDIIIIAVLFFDE